MDMYGLDINVIDGQNQLSIVPTLNSSEYPLSKIKNATVRFETSGGGATKGLSY